MTGADADSATNPGGAAAGSSNPQTRPQARPAGVKSMPLSPHLQIWGWTATMAASITHRATGIALYSGTILLAFWVFAVSQGPGFFAPVGAFMTSPFGLLILFGYVWALCFHLLGGLRYLYFDSGRGLAPKTASMTAWLLYAASFILAIIIAWAALAARSGA